MSHKKFGPDRFSRFDVYWIQTNKQTDKQTDKPNLYIEERAITKNRDKLIMQVCNNSNKINHQKHIYFLQILKILINLIYNYDIIQIVNPICLLYNISILACSPCT